MSPEPLDLNELKPGRGKQKFLADLLKTYSSVLLGASFITPAFSARPMSGINGAWAIVAALLAVFSFILTPEE